MQTKDKKAKKDMIGHFVTDFVTKVTSVFVTNHPKTGLWDCPRKW